MSRRCLLHRSPSQSVLRIFWSFIIVPRKERISQEESGSKVELEVIQGYANEETLTSTNTQQEVKSLVEHNDII